MSQVGDISEAAQRRAEGEGEGEAETTSSVLGESEPPCQEPTETKFRAKARVILLHFLFGSWE